MQATDVLNATASGTITTTNDRVGSTKLGKEEFLKLFLTQLGNQDPTSPVDSEAFVAQLAQFASLEQITNVNQNLESLVLAQTNATQTNAANLIGKEALYRTNRVTLGPEGPASDAFIDLPSAAGNVTVVVKDEAGHTVRTLKLGPQPNGRHPVSFDGHDDNGKRVPPGRYQIEVMATDDKGKPMDVDLRARGVVEGVSYANGFAELVIGSAKVSLADVEEVSSQRSSTP